MATAPGPEILQLTVAEQPTKLQRFRYFKEVQNGRLGSVLHGRSSVKNPVKIYVKLVTEDPQILGAGNRFKLVGCTVFEDLVPHPFFLAGNNCTNGLFEKEFSLSGLSNSCDISLEHVGIICTPKLKSGKPSKANKSATEAAEDYQRRLKICNFFKKPEKINPFQGKEVNKLRLAFQVFVTSDQPSVGSSQQQWLLFSGCKPVFTEVIADAKIYSKLTIDFLIPDTVERRDQDVWFYMKDPLPVEVVTRYKVVLEDANQEPVCELQASNVKKHLVVFNFSGIGEKAELSGAHFVRLLDTEDTNGDCSEAVEIQLRLKADQSSEPSSKRARRENPGLDDFILDELLTFASDPGAIPVPLEGSHGEASEDVQMLHKEEAV